MHIIIEVLLKVGVTSDTHEILQTTQHKWNWDLTCCELLSWSRREWSIQLLSWMISLFPASCISPTGSWIGWKVHANNSQIEGLKIYVLQIHFSTKHFDHTHISFNFLVIINIGQKIHGIKILPMRAGSKIGEKFLVRNFQLHSSWGTCTCTYTFYQIMVLQLSRIIYIIGIGSGQV